MGTPKKLPIFFISQKMGNRNKKKMCTKWEFSKKSKNGPSKKNYFGRKKIKLVLKGKNVVS